MCRCIIRALTKPDKRRNNTEQLQAIGNVTAMRIVQSTNQLWIGVEDTNKGALYVYDLPDMNNYYSGQLQVTLYNYYLTILIRCNTAHTITVYNKAFGKREFG